jgi:hypothetical protein
MGQLVKMVSLSHSLEYRTRLTPKPQKISISLPMAPSTPKEKSSEEGLLQVAFLCLARMFPCQSDSSTLVHDSYL